MDASGRSMKAQMKQAGKAAARFALIIGEDEARCGTVTCKDMGTSEQRTAPVNEIIEMLTYEVKG